MQAKNVLNLKILNKTNVYYFMKLDKCKKYLFIQSGPPYVWTAE